MPVNFTPEESEAGKANFETAINLEAKRDQDGKIIGYDRRDFLKGSAAAAIAGAGGLGTIYFGYGDAKGMEPVRIAFLGTGDEGNVLIGALNPKYLQVVAISDVRPFNQHRAFYGDYSNENTLNVRPGLIKKYGYKDYDDAKKHIEIFDDFKELLKNAKRLKLEGVVIALPLHLHAQAAILAMRTGLHVLTEKLMGHSVLECKEMGRVANVETKKILATGHQRHNSILYANAVHTIKNGFIGDVHSIRAQWHRQNDTWSPPLPNKEDGIKKLSGDIKNAEKKIEELKKGGGKSKEIDFQIGRLAQLKKQLEDDSKIDAAKYGYESKEIVDKITDAKYTYEPLEELIRWRLWERTGGGLMAELGSHQLDASTIFCTAARDNDKKAHPLAVTAIGGRFLYDLKREAEDHVYCIFEFPGPKYDKDKNNKIIVTYSSINGNGFGDYGEVVMGTKGTLVLLREQDTSIVSTESATAKLSVNKDVVDTTASGGAKAAVKVSVDGPISKGYQEELEHWAWCIRNYDAKNFPPVGDGKDAGVHFPRCHPEAAMADAIIALTTNIAMRNPEMPRIEFKHEWFNVTEDATPERDVLGKIDPAFKDLKPNIEQEKYKIDWDKV